MTRRPCRICWVSPRRQRASHIDTEILFADQQHKKAAAKEKGEHHSWLLRPGRPAAPVPVNNVDQLSISSPVPLDDVDMQDVNLAESAQTKLSIAASGQQAAQSTSRAKPSLAALAAASRSAKPSLASLAQARRAGKPSDSYPKAHSIASSPSPIDTATSSSKTVRVDGCEPPPRLSKLQQRLLAKKTGPAAPSPPEAKLDSMDTDEQDEEDVLPESSLFPTAARSMPEAGASAFASTLLPDSTGQQHASRGDAASRLTASAGGAFLDASPDDKVAQARKPGIAAAKPSVR